MSKFRQVLGTTPVKMDLICTEIHNHTPDEIAAASYTFRGHPVFMRIVHADEGYALLLHAAGVTVSRVCFAGAGELGKMLPTICDQAEIGYVKARDELIRQFYRALYGEA